jgi:hypothetical protein
VAETHLDGGNQPPAPGSPGAGSLIPVNQRIVTWDAQGNPLVRNQQVFTKAQVSEIAMAAASERYVSADDELAVELGIPPSEYYGLTNLEVMLIKQARWAATSGETDVIEKVLDRLIGRPKQTSESHSIVETYEEALKRIGGKIVDAEVVE